VPQKYHSVPNEPDSLKAQDPSVCLDPIIVNTHLAAEAAEAGAAAASTEEAPNTEADKARRLFAEEFFVHRSELPVSITDGATSTALKR
jgi:hypothetical protein